MSNVINELQSLKGLRMKIRKSLLAAATAAVVSVSGVVAAPAFAEETTTTTTPAPEAPGKDNKGSDNGSSTNNGGETDKDQDKDKKSFFESFKELSSDKDGNWDPKAITAWIAVFTAVLGLVANIITFAQKNFTQK